MTRVSITAATLLCGLFPFAPPAAAQLIGDYVRDDTRTCIYAGSDATIDGQIIPRNNVIPASQPCPDAPPYRDPNRRAPGNAALMRETTERGQRHCVYEQGGVEYTRVIELTQRCAMTPDLLDRLLADRRPGAAR